MDALAQLNSALSGRYTIEREIGAGGMATVYLARDVRHERNVALKVLNPELGAVLGGERFLSEIKVTANLQHPHLLPLFDSGEAEGLLFYVMPYVEGESLRARLDRERQLPIEEAVRIAMAIASALDYAHRHGVIHRDLKPENILLHEGQPLVADFGIALAVSKAGGNRITQTGLSLGTPQYMSPEQATGDRVIDGRTDIYSLAAVLYEMLTGDPPHVGSTAHAIMAQLMTERPRPVRATRSTVPPHVAAALDKALEKLPADRWATAQEFAEALRGHGFVEPSGDRAPADEAAGAAPAAPAAAPQRSFLRRALSSPVWAAAFAVAAVAAVWGWAAGRRAEPAQLIRVGISVAPAQPLGGTAYRTLAISPDGMSVIYSTLDSANVARVFVRRLSEGTSHAIAGTVGARRPFFSADGRSIAFFAGGQLRRAALDGESSTPLTDILARDSTPEAFIGGSWGPSGIVVSINSRLAEIPAGGGAPRFIGLPDSVTGFAPIVLPGGRQALYGTRQGVGVVDLASGQHTILVDGSTPLGVIDGQLIYGRGDGVFAVPFDAKRQRITGTPVVLLAGVLTDDYFGMLKASLSANGSLAYLSGSNRAELALAERGGRAVPVAGASAGLFGYPRFSPDGKRIAFAQHTGDRTDIWVLDVASGLMTRVTTEGPGNSRPEWAPDGKRVLFVSDGGLWWQPWDGTGKREPLVTVNGRGIAEGTFSPDGQWIVYRTGGAANADVWYRAVRGDTTTRSVADSRFSEMAARVSPDGRWVAYQSTESGAAEVYVHPFPGPGPRTRISIGGGAWPVWSPDGRQLYYVAGDQLVAASVVPGASFAVTARAPLLKGQIQCCAGHAGYDITRDGRVLLLRPVGESEEIVVLHNWAAELRARLAGNR
ncbi:MAG: protein kinase [Gemmatimonadota bacterium]|nr:protein kinase [Gemmatimonadota bacterium]